MRKFPVSRRLLTKLSIAIGIVVLSLGSTLVLTDPAPSTLPRRARTLLADSLARWTSPPENLPLRPLVDIPVIKAEAAGHDVRDEYFVVGVELNGQSRAYPLNMLSRPDHHVLNDILGGQPIAVTWCGLCQSPVVYARQVEGKTLTLFVSGELYGENMLMKDVETGSDWPQMLGEAVEGPLKGKSLESIPSMWSDWKSWRTTHPDTTVLNIAQTIDYYRRDPVASPSSFENRYFAGLQWGFIRQGKAFSWPLRDLAKKPVVNVSLADLPIVLICDRESATITAFERRVGRTELTFRLENRSLIDDQTASVWNPLSGKAIQGSFAGQHLNPIAGIVSHLRAWSELHPAGELHTVRPS